MEIKMGIEMQFYLLSKDAGLRSTQLNNEIK